MEKKHRQAEIVSLLRERGTALVSELSKKTGVSPVTIRNDLDDLAAQRKIIRSHGGAICIERLPANAFDSAPFPHAPHITNLKYKEAIAAAAIRLISGNDSIFIGGGSTFYVFSKLLKPFKNLKIVTTNVNVLYELSPYISNIYFIGGELVEMNGIYYTGGPKIPLELEKVFVNKAFIGISGIDLKAGLTIYDLSQLNIYMRIPHITQNVVLMCDYTKFGFQSAHKIGPIEGFASTIVTNKMVDMEYITEIKKMGIDFITA